MRDGLDHGLVVVVSRHILVLGSCSRSLVESESRLDPESATKSESRSNLTFFFISKIQKIQDLCRCLEYWCISLGIKLRDEGGCVKVYHWAGRQPLSPMPPVRRRLLVLSVKCGIEKEEKRWDNSNLAIFLDSKIHV